jgi:DNA-binding response OmpR family regulator
MIDEPKPIILIVDDEKEYAKATSRALEHYGYPAYVAHGAVEAMSLLKEITPRVMLIDIMMPEVDGLTLLRHIGSKPEFLHTRLVVVSANGLAKNRAAAWLAGADAFLGKPFTFDELHAIIEHVLGEVPPPSGRQLPQ